MRPSCARPGTHATARRSRGGAATPRAPGWRAGSPRRCRSRARSGSPARAGCDGRRRRSGRSARSAGTSARARRRGGRSCPTGGRARRSSPDSGGGRGRARAPRGSLRARSVSAPAGAPAGSPRRAHGRSARTPSRSRSGRPGRAASRAAAAAARAGRQRRVLGVLRAVVGDQHRALRGGVRMGPDQGGQLGPEDLARDRDALRLADRLGGDPLRRRVARLLPDGLVAPGAARRLRVGRVDDPLAPALGVDQLELVLEARDVRRRRGQLPRLAAALQLVRQPVAELVGEADGRRGVVAGRGAGSGFRSRECVDCVPIRAQNRPFGTGRAVSDTRRRARAQLSRLLPALEEER